MVNMLCLYGLLTASSTLIYVQTTFAGTGAEAVRLPALNFIMAIICLMIPIPIGMLIRHKVCTEYPLYYTIYPLYTPFIHLHHHMSYIYVHPLYMYLHHIYTQHTSKQPTYTLYIRLKTTY